MISFLAVGLMLQAQGTPGNAARAYVFGGGNEPPPSHSKIAELLQSSGSAKGWKDLTDGKILYVSPKQITYVFLPSLREIRNWKTAMFFRKKIESGGFWTNFTFDELPEFLKKQVESSYPDLDFVPTSGLQVEVKFITNLSSQGRKISLPFDLMPSIPPGKRNTSKLPQKSIVSELLPIESKRDFKADGKEEPWRPFYQIWNLNVAFDSGRTEMVDEALRLINIEMAKRTAVETKALLDLLKDNKQFLAYQDCVGKPVDFSTPNPDEDRTRKSIGRFLGVARGILGLHEGDDWNNFTQHATVDSLSLGFSVNFVRKVKGQRQMVGVGF